MKIQFLGSGGGLVSPRINYHSNLAIYFDETKMLGLDCGSHFQMAIESLQISPNQFDAFYISHLHADHIGGLEWLAFTRYFGTYPFGTNRPKLYGNGEILDRLWKKSLSGGLESIQNKRNHLNSYFEPFPIKPNGEFIWNGVKFQLVQTLHVIDDRRIQPSYGLNIISSNGKIIFWTGDTQFAPNQIWSFYRDAEIIFHDCELAKYPESVHAQYHELCTLPLEFKNKMWLYHYSSDFDSLPPDWKEQGFLGFVSKGQIFDFLDF